jgi:hypothetical protein
MRKGTTHTDETKARIAASLEGTKGTPAKSRAISSALKGKPKSQQHRENMRLSALARFASQRAERSDDASN